MSGLVLIGASSFGAWMYRMERLGTQLVEQGRSSAESRERNEKAIGENKNEIKKLDSRVDQHDIEFQILHSKFR